MSTRVPAWVSYLSSKSKTTALSAFHGFNGILSPTPQREREKEISRTPKERSLKRKLEP